MVETIVRRPASEVMRLERMGSFHQSRLSFMRLLLRRAKAEGWTFDRLRFDIADDGTGTALYAVTTPARTYTLVAFSHDLPDEQRSDRVIATAWDATFTLFDGVPTDSDIERLRANVPLQEAGRITESELTLARANRSMRLWDHVIDALAAGRQPDRARIDEVGYLMRTTAVYGSGKFGAADRLAIADRSEFTAPFQVEMLTVFLIRAFVLDLVEHLAASSNPSTAVVMDPDMRRRLGIGNSTGLGMAPFLLKHPRLINNWIAAREDALVRVRQVDRASQQDQDRFIRLVQRSRRNVELWRSEHPAQQAKLSALLDDLDLLDARLATVGLDGDLPWDGLIRWSADHLSVEGQELLVSLVMEPYGDLIDGVADRLHADESEPVAVDGSMSLDELDRRLRLHYGWTLGIDWTDPAADARAWYVSEEKLEPRLGDRYLEPIDAFEQPLQPGRDAARLIADLAAWPPAATVAELLNRHPEHRHTVQRLAVLEEYPYAEIHDNTIAADVLPIDLLRCKLSFFGATHFDPRSDRWVRINMYRGAPFPHELDELSPAEVDDWIYPTIETDSDA